MNQLLNSTPPAPHDDSPNEIPQDAEMNLARSAEHDIVQHYAASTTSVRGVLEEILTDQKHSINVHSWERKHIIGPVKELSLKLSMYLASENLTFDYLLAYSVVDEITTQDGTTIVYPAMTHPGNVDRHLFFAGTRAHAEVGKNTLSESASGISSPTKPVRTRGRTIYLDPNLPSLQRAMTLLVFASCIRLQNEDCGYIYKFIERHLAVCNMVREPHQWQETSGPQIDNSRQKFYRRVSLSCHLVYLTLSPKDEDEDPTRLVDRVAVFPFHHPKKTHSPTGLYLFKSTSSTLLTVCLPEKSPFKAEDLDLLGSLTRFWVVLAVNCVPGFATDKDADQHLAPITQYIRGITSSLVTARLSTQSILDALKNKLDACENGELFDDENFAKSTLFHWTVRTCEQLRTTNKSSLRFVRRILPTHVQKFANMAHSSERIGIAFWTSQLEDELMKLDDLQDQISALSTQVQESRNALHGATALLEARTALQQGERIKTLSYLATIYLPLMAAASLYSMSVLPPSTTLYSFFFVLVGLLLFTIITGLYLPTILLPIYRLLTSISTTVGLTAYFHRLFCLVGNTREARSPGFALREYGTPKNWIMQDLWVIIKAPRFLFEGVVRVMAAEMKFPRDQFIMAQYMGNSYVNYRWHPLAFARDFVRLILLPVWAAVIVGLVGYIVVFDLVASVLSLLL